MTTGDYMKAMFKAFANSDDATFREVAQALIAEERMKGHVRLAGDLERILRNGQYSLPPMTRSTPLPVDKERGLPLAHVEHVDFGWERVILTSEVTETLRQVADEFRRKERLNSYGVKPKQKLLFFGPAGCGKTITARALAGELGLPLLFIRFDSLVSSYLGETAANLRKVFDFAVGGNWVVLFDEFDAIGKGRDNPFEHGELKRVVNSVLQLMDEFSGQSLLIAATNHESLLDEALWRRFDEICYFGFPSPEHRALLVKKFMGGFRLRGVDVGAVAARMGKMSGDDVEKVCLEAIKRAILSERAEVSRRDFSRAVARQKKRRSMASKA